MQKKNHLLFELSIVKLLATKLLHTIPQNMSIFVSFDNNKNIRNQINFNINNIVLYKNKTYYTIIEYIIIYLNIKCVCH